MDGSMKLQQPGPNHALQRTAPRVTLAAADRSAACAHPAPYRLRPQPARRAPQSLSLGSVGGTAPLRAHPFLCTFPPMRPLASRVFPAAMLPAACGQARLPVPSTSALQRTLRLLLPARRFLRRFARRRPWRVPPAAESGTAAPSPGRSPSVAELSIVRYSLEEQGIS